MLFTVVKVWGHTKHFCYALGRWSVVDEKEVKLLLNAEHI